MINQFVLEKHVTRPTVAKGLLFSHLIVILGSNVLAISFLEMTDHTSTYIGLKIHDNRPKIPFVSLYLLSRTIKIRPCIACFHA